MAYPSDLPTVTVRHRIVGTDGTPARGGGRVTAVLTGRLWTGQGSVVPTQYTATVQEDGTYELVLPPVDHPDIVAGRGEAYLVTEPAATIDTRRPGRVATEQFHVAPVTEMVGQTVDVSDVLVNRPKPGGGVERVTITGPATDPSMAAIIADPSSQTAASLKDTIGTETDRIVPAKVAEALADVDTVAQAAAQRAGESAADPLIAGVLSDRDSDAARAVIDLSGTGISATQTVMGKIARGVEDVRILLIGDSTGDSTTEWFHELGQRLAADWTSHTVTYYDYDHNTHTYDDGVSLATGTGAQTIELYNASLAGANSKQFLGATFGPAIRDVQADLIMVSLMHNEDVTTSFPNAMLGRWTALLESTTQAAPHADIIVIAQNPASGNTNQQRRATYLQRLATERGYGFIDVLQHWLDHEPTPGAWTADGVHPNTEGTKQWTDVVHAHFRRDPRAQPLVRQPSSFLSATENFLPNGGFHDYTGPGAPDGWTSTNLNITKDTSRYESPKGYSLKLAGTAAGQATLNYSFPGVGPFQAMLGEWITVAVRMFVPAGSPASFGRIAVVVGGGGGTYNEPSQTAGQGGWRWAVMPVYVTPTATYLQLIIYANVSSTGTADINVDRVVVARGTLPRDAVL